MMADVFAPEKRSLIMSRIKGRDTRPEILVRSLLHRMGYRFRLHRRDLPGCPDIVFAKHRKVIFVHGCFWHGHPGCRRSERPTANREFWQKKLSGNVERDRKNRLELEKLGWKILIVWTCETRDVARLEGVLKHFMSGEDNE